MFDVETSLTKPLSGRVYVNLLEGIYIYIYLLEDSWSMFHSCRESLKWELWISMAHHPRVAKSLILRRTHVILLLTVDIYPHYISLYIYTVYTYIIIYVYIVYIMFDVSQMISLHPQHPQGTALGVCAIWRSWNVPCRRWVVGRSDPTIGIGATSKSSSQELDCDHALNALWSDPSVRNWDLPCTPGYIWLYYISTLFI